MLDDANIDTVRQWIDSVWNHGDVDRLCDFHPATFENEGRPTTVDEASLWHSKNRETFPDLQYVIDDVIATEDRVAIRWTATATHLGFLWDLIPATGKRIMWNGMHFLRLAEGKIIEIWALQNTVSLIRQFGATLHPPTPSN